MPRDDRAWVRAPTLAAASVQQMVDEGFDDGREVSAARIDYVDRR